MVSQALVPGRTRRPSSFRSRTTPMTPLDQITPGPQSSPGTPPQEEGPVDRTGVPSSSRTNVLPVLLVSTLAFLLASFPARNTDLWMHLAAGRHLVRGEYPLSP